MAANRGGGSGTAARVGGFAMRDDDWEVTRLASLQPIRAEQIGFLWFLLF